MSLNIFEVANDPQLEDLRHATATVWKEELLPATVTGDWVSVNACPNLCQWSELS